MGTAQVSILYDADVHPYIIQLYVIMDVLMVSVLVQIHVHVTVDGLDQHVLQVVKYMSI